MADEATLRIKIEDAGGGASAGAGGSPGRSGDQGQRTKLDQARHVLTAVNQARMIVQSLIPKKPTEVIVVGFKGTMPARMMSGMPPIGNQPHLLGGSNRGSILDMFRGQSGRFEQVSGMMGRGKDGLKSLLSGAAEMFPGVAKGASGLIGKGGSMLGSGATGAAKLVPGMAAGAAGLAGKAGVTAGVAGAAAGTGALVGLLALLGPLGLAIGAVVVGLKLFSGAISLAWSAVKWGFKMTIGLVQTGFEAVGKASKFLVADIARRREELAEFSGNISRAKAEAEARNINRNVGQAQLMGGGLAQLESANAKIGNVFDEALAAIEAPLVDMIAPMVEGIAVILEQFLPLIKLVGKTNQMISDSGVIDIVMLLLNPITRIAAILKFIGEKFGFEVEREAGAFLDQLMNINLQAENGPVVMRPQGLEGAGAAAGGDGGGANWNTNDPGVGGFFST